jgi:hypothetical protein
MKGNSHFWYLRMVLLICVCVCVCVFENVKSRSHIFVT